MPVASSPREPVAALPGSSTAPTAVNVDELAARIHGYNFALAAVESALAEQKRWDARALEPVVTELRELRDIYQMLSQYRELIGQDQLPRLARLANLEYVIATVSGRISDARMRLVSSASAHATAEEQAELARLESISKQVATLAMPGG